MPFLLAHEIIAERESTDANEYYTIDDLPLMDEQKKCVLEWLAWKLLQVIRSEPEAGDTWGGKSYDPLKFSNEDPKIVHSYLFDLWDGGRHHEWSSLKQIEDALVKETTEKIHQSSISRIVFDSQAFDSQRDSHKH